MLFGKFCIGNGSAQAVDTKHCTEPERQESMGSRIALDAAR